MICPSRGVQPPGEPLSVQSLLQYHVTYPFATCQFPGKTVYSPTGTRKAALLCVVCVCRITPKSLGVLGSVGQNAPAEVVRVSSHAGGVGVSIVALHGKVFVPRSHRAVPNLCMDFQFPTSILLRKCQHCCCSSVPYW
eukprot:UN27192